MNAAKRSGFTLVELLVVLVLGTILVLASYQTLATNTRVYAVNGARAQGQQALRGAVDILTGELREISLPGGDLMKMKPDYLTIRAQRALGIVCSVDYSASPAELATFWLGPPFEVGDSIFVFHDNDTERVSDDEWFVGTISAVDNSTYCAGQRAQTLSVPFVSSTAAASPPDSVRVGAPIRGFEIFTYGEYVLDGETYLGRESSSSTWTPLIGPLLPTHGLAFRYLDQDGQVTSQISEVAQIEVTLRYESDLASFQNEPVSDSLVVRVYPRN